MGRRSWYFGEHKETDKRTGIKDAKSRTVKMSTVSAGSLYGTHVRPRITHIRRPSIYVGSQPRAQSQSGLSSQHSTACRYTETSTHAARPPLATRNAIKSSTSLGDRDPKSPKHSKTLSGLYIAGKDRSSDSWRITGACKKLCPCVRRLPIVVIADETGK